MSDLNLKAIISAEDKASSTLSGVGSSFASLGAQAVKYGAVAVGAFAAATTFAVKNAADVQMIRQSFDTLLGSAEKGKALFSDLQKMANVTPFETQDLAQAAQTLLAYGVTTKDILPDIKMLGDVSLGNKNKFNMLSLAFSQVASTGRLMGQDLLQMTSQGFNPLQIISEKTGKSMLQLRKEMEKGNISFAMVEDAFKTATAEGGKFHDGMEKGSKTLVGVMSTLSDNVKITARSIVGLSESGDVVKGGLFDKVSIAVAQLISYLDANKEAIVRVGTAFMTNFLTAIQTIVGWIVTATKFITEHKDLLIFLAGVVGGILTAAFIAWGVAVIVATWPILAIGLAIGLVVVAIKKMIDWWPAIMDFFGGLWDNIVGWFNGIPGAISGALRSVYDVVTAPFRSAFNAIKGFWNDTVGKIKVNIPNWVPSIGGKSFGFPTFAQGTNFAPGGMALVGERGPELVNLPRGSQVIPNNKIGKTQNVTVNIYGGYNPQGMTPDQIGQSINRQLELSQIGAY